MISANTVARVVVNSRIPSRNSAFSRILHFISAKSRIPRMLDSSLSSVKTWRPCGFSDSAMTKKKLKIMRFVKYLQYSFHTRRSFHKKNHIFWKTKPNFWHNIQLCSLSKSTKAPGPLTTATCFMYWPCIQIQHLCTLHETLQHWLFQDETKNGNK